MRPCCFIYVFRVNPGPHSVAKCVGCVTRDHLPLWLIASLWTYIPVVPNWVIKCLVISMQTDYCCVHLNDPLETFENIKGLSLGSGFQYVTDLSIKVTKGDIKHQSTIIV